jgi:hypothetical protein
MKKNIYSHESQEVIIRFSKVNPSEYIIVPIDYTGKEHITGELLLMALS